jgi:SAM-dependent methyltransferase
VGNGWRCLDVGGGPGFVAMDLRERVGEEGTVTILEPSGFYLDWFHKTVATRQWRNVASIRGTAEEATLPVDHFDLVFIRWVIAFVSDPEKFLIQLFKCLRPGGIIAVQDYYYEGLSLFPHGGPFDAMPEAVRLYYRSVGGDPYVTGRLPAIFKRYGLHLIDFSPHSLAGGPHSGVMEWAHRFFTVHTRTMVEKKIVAGEQATAMLDDWNSHRANPDALFFSPIVVDVAARRPL